MSKKKYYSVKKKKEKKTSWLLFVTFRLKLRGTVLRGVGGAALRVIGGGGRVRLGTCYWIRLPSPPPQRTNSSVPHRQTDRRSVFPRQQHHQHRENKLSLAAALAATNCRGAERQGAERPGAMGNAKCYRVL